MQLSIAKEEVAPTKRSSSSDSALTTLCGTRAGTARLSGGFLGTERDSAAAFGLTVTGFLLVLLALEAFFIALVRVRNSFRVGASSRSANFATVAFVGVKSLERHRRHPELLHNRREKVV